MGVPGEVNVLGVPEVPRACVLIVDGLGWEQLKAHPDEAPYLNAMDGGPITAGFPATTVTSLASLGTGAPPGGHGLLGLQVAIPGAGRLLNCLHWKGDDPDPATFQPVPTAYERAAADGVAVTVVSKPEFGGSGLTRAVLRGGEFTGAFAFGDLAARVVTALSEPGRRLVYGYHADLDAMGHVYGPGSLPWRLQLRQVDRLVETIVSLMPPDALLAVTGDHGMVTMDRTFDADTDPVLRAGVRAFSGEPRARHVHTEPGAAADVLATWQGVLGDAAWTASREQAVDEGWFGPLSPHFADRIGDVVAAARGTAGVIRSAAESFLSGLIGQHGSLTPEEQLVPLLVARA
jgi:hypothetical protein